MIEAMTLLAFLAGLVVGWLLLARRRIDYVLLAFHFLHIRSQSAFEAIYASTDDKATFERYKISDPTVHAYADYLRLHSAVRETAYERYRSLYSRLLRSVLFYTPPAIILLAIVFTRWWYFYLLGVGTMFVILFTNKFIVTNHRIGYYQRMMISAILANYQKEHKRKTK
jgi:hypothetical protein